jgi:hypothetical protein
MTSLKTNKSFLPRFFSKKRVLSLKKAVAFLKKSSAKNFCPLALVCVAGFAQADTVSAAVGRPIERAEALIQARNYHAALVELYKASRAGALTSYERGAIAQLHGTAEAGAGNYAQAAVDYQTVLAAGGAPPAEQLQFTQAIAGFYFQAGDTKQTVTWVNRYIAAGGTDARTQALLPQAYAQQGDYAQAEHAVQAAQAHGTVLPLAELQLLAYSAQKAGDEPGYFAALLALLQTAPNPSTWDAAITTVAGAPDFPDTLTIEVYRLRRATGTLSAPGDYEDYTERAILAGQPQEARAVIDAGFTNGILNTTTDNGHAARLKALADSSATPAAAQTPPDALQPAFAQYQAGQAAQAAASFNSLAAQPGVRAQNALARLWAIQAQNAARAN